MALGGSKESVRPSSVGGEETVIHCNRQRDKTFSQMMREAEKLDEIETEKARRAQLAHLRQGDKGPVQETFPEREPGQTRDKVAEAIGIGSGKQYEKAKKVWEEAAAGKTLVANLAQAFTYRYRTLTTDSTARPS